jgi:hypothetical protein
VDVGEASVESPEARGPTVADDGPPALASDRRTVPGHERKFERFQRLGKYW